MSLRLYQCCSTTVDPDTTGRLFLGQCVEIYWYRVGPRNMADHEYHDLIKGYSSMNTKVRRWMQWYADCYFIKDEIEQLVDYLTVRRNWASRAQLVADGVNHQFKYTVNHYIEAETIPPTRYLYSYFHDDLPNKLCVGEFQQFHREYPWCFIQLMKYPDFDLPFKVWGQYLPK